mgnify:CR=1 FL=1
MGNGLSDRKADTQELMQIRQEAYEAASQLLAAAHPKKGSILVVGCSTSEVAGERIGSFSSPELGQALFDGVYQAAKEVSNGTAEFDNLEIGASEPGTDPGRGSGRTLWL